jgi:hypothetical protein
MNAHERGGLRPDGGGVVINSSFVGRTNLAENRPTGGHHFGQTIAASDLYELAARHNHFATIGQRGERNERRAGVVVDDGG